MYLYIYIYIYTARTRSKTNSRVERRVTRKFVYDVDIVCVLLLLLAPPLQRRK